MSGRRAVAPRLNLSEFNRDALRMARQSRGVTQSEVADVLRVPQSRVSKIEDGLLSPRADELGAIAQFLDFPVEFFLHKGRMSGFGSCCLYHRKRKTMPVKALSMLHARMNCLTIGVERLLENASISPTVDFPDLDIDEFGSPEDVAAMVRATWRIPPGPISNLAHFVEAAGAIIVPMQFGTDKLDAVSLWPPEFSTPILFVNSEAPPDRQRFNIAHEVGHLVMHRVPTPDAEREADRFASELLMPSREIKAELSGMTVQKASRLKLKWRTAMSALIMKARDTGAISPRRAKSLFSEMSQMGYRKREPVAIEPDECKTLDKIIIAHRRRLNYSTEDLMKLTFCTSQEQFARRYETTGKSAFRVVG